MTLGANTTCDYRFFWDGGAAGIHNTATGVLNPIDGLNIGYLNDTMASLLHSADASAADNPNAVELEQPGHENVLAKKSAWVNPSRRDA